MDSAVASAEELATRPFSAAPADTSDWLEGAAQSGTRAHFDAIAVFESLHETPADYDGTAWQLWEQAYGRFEQHRQEVVAALTVRVVLLVTVPSVAITVVLPR